MALEVEIKRYNVAQMLLTNLYIMRIALTGLFIAILIVFSGDGLVVLADGSEPEDTTGNPPSPTGDKPKHTRLDSRLNHLVDQIGSDDTEDIASNAPISIGDLVAVTIRHSNNSSGTIEFLESVGALVANIGTDYIEAYVPVTTLVPLSERTDVLKVLTIFPAKTDVTSQGAAIHGSPDWNSRGYTGTGIKVGVIDGGFIGYSSLMGTELPGTVNSRCYTTIGVFNSTLAYCETSSVHGTGVAEAIVDIAPDVTLYISNPISKSDLQSTAAWMVSEGVQVINTSLKWSWDGPGDGTSPYSNSPLKVVDEAVEDGSIWVKSAGNDGDGDNWYGAYSDEDTDGWLAFSTSSDNNPIWLTSGTDVTVALRWDDNWWTASSDLNLYLYDYDSSWIKLASSEDVQDGSVGQDPVEYISYSVLSTGWYYLYVDHHAGIAPEWFQLDVWSGQNLDIFVSDHSISNPGDSSNTGMLTVGAANWATPETIESFSSRGPTTDGRIKPDIVGADRGDSVAYGVNGFAGTSQAAPHVAGLAALVRQRYPEYTPAQVAAYLKDNAQGIDTVPNNTWGYGLAQMPSLIPDAPSTPDLSSQTDNGVSDSDNITSIFNPTFTGTAYPESTVQLFRADTILLGSTTADSNGDWTIKSSNLIQGANSITAKASVEDVTGPLTSDASTALTVTIEWDNLVEAPSLTGVTTLLLILGMMGALVLLVKKKRPRTGIDSL